MKPSSGRYVLLKKIAIGGMAEIFLARRLSLGGFAKFVVIKRLLPEHRGRKAFEQLFLTEARITAALDHPNIIHLHDLGWLDDTYFMAMEYVHGASAAEMMALAAKRGLRVPLEVALQLGRCVAEALHYGDVSEDLDGQPMRVVHHDVSPHNIQVGFNGQVKLLDYGVATQVGHPAPGGRRGKFAYMSPEAIKRRPDLDPRCDLYSLGVCLFELCLGRRLFKGNTPDETRQRAMIGRIPAPTSVEADFPPALEAVLMRALARDPDQRYPHGKALADDLAQVAAQLKLELSMSRVQAFMQTLYGELVGLRREELRQLALASTPRETQEPAAAPPAPQAAAPEPPAPTSPSQMEASVAEAISKAVPIDERTPSPVEQNLGLSSQDRQRVEAAAQAAVQAGLSAPAQRLDLSELPVGANDADEADWDGGQSKGSGSPAASADAQSADDPAQAPAAPPASAPSEPQTLPTVPTNDAAAGSDAAPSAGGPPSDAVPQRKGVSPGLVFFLLLMAAGLAFLAGYASKSLG